MGMAEDLGFKVLNLENRAWSHATKDTYLICQRLDRIIRLLEGQDKTPIPTCPHCGVAGVPHKLSMALGEPATVVGSCGHEWIVRKESNPV